MTAAIVASVIACALPVVQVTRGRRPDLVT